MSEVTSVPAGRMVVRSSRPQRQSAFRRPAGAMRAQCPLVPVQDLSAALGDLNFLRRMLVVGDTGMHLHILADLLRDHAIEALACEGRQRAIDAVRDRRFDLLVMELTRPRPRWRVFLRSVLEASRGVDVLVISADTAIQNEVRMLASRRLQCISPLAPLARLIAALSRRARPLPSDSLRISLDRRASAVQ